MKTLIKILFALVMVALAAAVGLGLLLFSGTPTVQETAPLTADDVATVRNLLQQTALRNPAPGSLNQLSLSAHELEQAANYLLQSRRAGSARVSIVDGTVSVAVSLQASAASADVWLNVALEFTGAGAEGIAVERLKFGRMTLPASVSKAVLAGVHAELMQETDYARLVSTIKDVTVKDGMLIISYQWQPALMGQLAARGRELVLEPGQQERLSTYAAELARLTRELGAPGKQSVVALLAPMLRFAGQRGGSAVEENRAALQVLALYVINVDADRLLGDIKALGRVVRHDLRLSGRRDFAQHLLISAALAASAGSTLASEIGVLKEEQDSKSGGSGFSFTDIAIDQAGTRVGQLAVAGETAATRLQRVLGATNLQETLFTPAVDDLPEYLSQQEFAKRFTVIGSPAYEDMMRTISDRISHLPLEAQLQQEQ